MGKNRLIVAAAGSGKTTHLVREAIKIKDRNVLVTTFTEANEEAIKKRFVKECGIIPQNITVQTWFSFLIQHGIKPYQGGIFEKRVNGLSLVSGQSSSFTKEAEVEKYYFDTNHRVYSDKLSKFVLKCNVNSNGEVISRISRIYPYIYVDEVQDLAGYDLEVLKALLNSTSHILLVGDPRQGTYSTNNSAKNKKFRRAQIVNFFEDDSIKIDTDDSSLMTNYRSCDAICDLSNKLYPDFKKITSGQKKLTGHDGIYFVKQKGIKDYLSKYNSVQLRWDSRVSVLSGYPVLNFGLSKGLEFDRVLIYPTTSFLAWLKNNSQLLEPISRAKFYVAITRARYSVGIVCGDD